MNNICINLIMNVEGHSGVQEADEDVEGEDSGQPHQDPVGEGEQDCGGADGGGECEGGDPQQQRVQPGQQQGAEV